MKGIIAFALAVPLFVGIGAWISRASRIHPPAPRARPPAPPPVRVSPGPLEAVEVAPRDPAVDRVHQEVDHEKEYARHLADYHRRIDELIASIDWTRAESRVRFPVEVDLIQAEFDRAVEGR